MQLDPRQIINGLRKRWWLALIVALVAAAVAYIYSNTQPRLYQASVTMVAKPVPPDNGLIEAIKKTLPTYAGELGNKQFWQSVVNSENIADVKVDDLPGQIKIQARPDENSIFMTVDNPYGLTAAIVADRISGAFVDKQNAENQSVTSGGQRVVWVVSQPPDIPQRPYQPRPTLYAGAAGAFGLLLGILLAIVLELLDTTLKNPTEVLDYTGLNTLGLIPKGSRNT